MGVLRMAYDRNDPDALYMFPVEHICRMRDIFGLLPQRNEGGKARFVRYGLSMDLISDLYLNKPFFLGRLISLSFCLSRGLFRYVP